MCEPRYRNSCVIPARGSCFHKRATNAGTNHRLRGLHRLAPQRSAACRRPLGPRGRLLLRQLRAVAQAGEPRARAPARRVRARARRPRRGAARRPRRRLRRRLPPRRRTGRALQLGASASRLYLRRNVHATQRLLDAASASPETPFVFASSSSIYGEAETPADARGRPPAALLALRGDEARRREPLPALPRQPRRAGDGAALLHRLRAPPAAGHGVSPLLPRGARRRAADGLRRRQPDPRLHLRRRRGGGHAPCGRGARGGRARLQHRRRLADQPAPSARAPR